ncbi:MAG: hypothetical protein U5K38_04200 [Woeseiaceae bacterium]|nr:hypothetical protein [Woeseiaceae bacterium]
MPFSRYQYLVRAEATQRGRPENIRPVRDLGATEVERRRQALQQFASFKKAGALADRGFINNVDRYGRFRYRTSLNTRSNGYDFLDGFIRGRCCLRPCQANRCRSTSATPKVPIGKVQWARCNEFFA